MPAADPLSRALAGLLRHRAVVLAAYLVAVPVAALLASRIQSQGAIEHLIVPTDPDYATTRAFQAIFPEPELVLLVFESPDPWSPASIDRVRRATAALDGVPHVTASSVIDALRRAQPTADPEALRRLAAGTRLFRRQGLVGDRFLTVIASLDVHTPAERDAALAGIDRALARAGAGPVREVGAPLVTAWLEHQSAAATARSMALFAILLIAIT
jgi:uncharacterized protein